LQSSHGFAGAGRADEQDVMAAGGGDLEGALDGFLAFDIGEIEFFVEGQLEEAVDVDLRRGNGGLAFEIGDGLAQVMDGDDLEAGDDGGFGGVVQGDEEDAFALGLGAEGDGEDAFDGADALCTSPDLSSAGPRARIGRL